MQAKTCSSLTISVIYISDVELAKTILFIKRSMVSGYAGIQNEVFFRDNTMLLFGDAKKMCEEVVQSLD
jgi:NAD(P) transhydrogenase subunit beta